MKTRFCPSPTGLMHLGNVRTALFNYLAAMNAQGSFLLRIEDTDKSRSYAEFTEMMLADLRWLGIVWQEGPEVGGDNGPYWQSERQAVYNKYYDVLEEKGMAYPCFCTEQQLALTRKLQRSQGKPPRYPRTCLKLTKEEVDAKIKAGEPHTLRFKVPHEETISFVDMVRGEQRFAGRDIADFIIRRADGSSPFMYANSIDDSLMGVTHLFRGEDHLTNTPRQLMILKALDLPLPEYGHMSLIVGEDGAPLSKRHGSKSLQELKETGFLPGALLNYLIRLGHTCESQSLLSSAEIVKYFNTKTFPKAAARFDEKQLLHWQKEAMMALAPEDVWPMCDEVVHNIVPSEQKALFIETVLPNIIFTSEATFWAKVCYEDVFDYSHDQLAILQDASFEFFNAAMTAVQETGDDYAALTAAVKEATGKKGKALFQPLRIALTGESHGPELAKLLTLLGKDRAIMRLDKALDACV